MDTVELNVLKACHEMIIHNYEIVPLLGDYLGIEQEKIFYVWAFRKCKQSGQIPHTSWSYFFHGLECDLNNIHDGRVLRIDFGPKGRIDSFTPWGVLQFVMTSKSPWSEFHELKSLFAAKQPPLDRFSGDFNKFCFFWDKLENQGYFDNANEHLIQLQKRYTIIGDDGIQHIKFPPTVSEETVFDCFVAHRKVLSSLGKSLFEYI